MNEISKPPAKPAPLGRGLSALFGDADASYQARPAGAPAERGVKTMPLTWLQPGSFQPRRFFDEEMLKGLAESIRERGILEPLLVRPVADARDAFEIIAGERRWRAAQMAGLHEVPVLVKTLSDSEALEVGLIENIQRQDLSPLEEAEGYRRLIEEFHHKQDDMAKIVGKSRAHISNMIRLLALPPAVRQMIDEGKLSAGHGRALITARDPLTLAQKVVRKQLSVRKTEILAQREQMLPKAKRKPEVTADSLSYEKEIERACGLRVKLHLGRGQKSEKGSVELFYTNLEQLTDLMQRLRGERVAGV